MKIFCLALIFLPIFFLFACSEKKNFSHSELRITNPWVRPASAGMTSAAYFTIENGTTMHDTLFSVECPDALRTEMHETTEENGLMRMKKISSVAVPSQSSKNFSPAGSHIMLIDLKRKFSLNDSVKILIKFAKSGKRAAYFTVKKSLAK